jgi:hypothetical protein
MMLRLLGENPGGDAKAMKKQLAPYVSHDATRREHYAEHFGPERLQSKRDQEPTIDDLLKLFGA